MGWKFHLWRRWQGDKRIDRVKRKHTKWVLNLDKRTTNYIITKESKSEELSIEGIKI